MEWRVLVVDDEAAADIKEVIEGQKTVAAPDSISCIECEDFSQAIGLLKRERFDLVILDLKDEGAHDQEVLAGEKVFEEIKMCRFVPVIFHTGFQYKVSSLNSPYVKVVARSEWGDLRAKIREVLGTKLPSLTRHIEEEQRKFMWESATKIWEDDLEKNNPADLVYLLARRLANLLSGEVVRRFLEGDNDGGAPKSDKVHAVELYVYPPLSKHFLFGDIFKKKNGDSFEYFIALTPSCDHAQNNAENVLLAKCKYLADTKPGTNAKTCITNGEAISSTTEDQLNKFIRDNSSPADRYKYLPGTSFLPDLLVDFQAIESIKADILKAAKEGYELIASLDSPFAESLQAKMVRYLGRIGTPDIDTDLALGRFKARMEKARKNTKI